MDVRKICTLAVACLTLAGPAGAQPRSKAPEAATCVQPVGAVSADEAACSSLLIGLSASPNPTPADGTVSFSWTVSPETDCWDNLGNSAWGAYSFAAPVSQPFTWVVSCSGSGVESATLDIAVEGSGGSDPPPPPSGDHDPKGFLDVVDAGIAAAYGWTCDPDAYGAALDVRFYADGAPGTGSFLGLATAGQTREPEVGDACGGNRDHGFAFPLPGSVRDGLQHSLYAYAVNVADGGNFELIGSPKSFQLPADRDADGVTDTGDDCPDDPNGDQADADQDGLGDACDIDIWLGVGTFTTWEDTTAAGASTGATTSASADTATTTEDTTTRCKLQRFVQTFTQAGLWDALRYEGMFRVCYVPTRRIVSISDVHGDMVWTAFYLSWFGNDAGYPYAVILGHKVEVYYRGTASFCIVPRYGCGPSKHPWVKISFWDNNTLQRTSGVT